ncbi:MAG: M4 family metallopeptidase, partial [Roseiflexaceae bacterium]
ALLGGPGLRQNTLNWRTEVTNHGPGQQVRELVLVDAHSGAVNLHFNQIMEAKERHICDDNNVADTANNQDAHCSTHANPKPFVRDEGAPAIGIPDVDLAYDFSGLTYDFYKNNFGRDSLDGAGLPLLSLVRYCPFACPYQNANWDGKQMTYGDGYATADDVVGHELTHGFTQFSSNLYYYFQAGAINESMSDVFGELIDLTDGRGTDTPATRWQLGEDLPADIGVIRDMKDPTLFDNPDRTGSPLYVTDPAEGDQGGVHSNSGVNNKAAYLMTDGATFNGYTITGLGIAKSAQIYYLVNNSLLTSGSDYQDLGDALQAACASLVGQHSITTADCGQVTKVVKATEMEQVPLTAPTPDAPTCETGQTVNNVFFDDLENLANKKWASAPVIGAINLWSYPQDLPTNPLGAPYATSGVNNFWGDDRVATAATYAIAMTQSVTLPANAFMHFDQAYDFKRAGTSNLNGGVVEYSTNNGTTWQDARALFTTNGYNTTIATGHGNPLAGKRGFGGLSNGYLSSRLKLSPLVGQNVRFRFRVGTENGADDRVAQFVNGGWFIDDIRIYTCGGAAPNTAPSVNPSGSITITRGGAAVTGDVATVSDVQDTAGTLHVVASGMPPGMTAATTNGDGLIAVTVNGRCATPPGTYFITLTASDSGGLVGTAVVPVIVEPTGQLVKDPGFELGSPNPYWDETGPGTGARLCDTGSCVTSATAGPRTGDWWGRFGSPLGTVGDGFIEQSIAIPAGSATLEFFLRISDHSGAGAADNVKLKIGSTTVFTVTDATTTYDNVYKKVTIDLTPFVGGTRTLRFEEHNNIGTAIFRVHIDDLTLISSPNVCTGVLPARAFLPAIER